jgi:hypothetical protein
MKKPAPKLTVVKDPSTPKTTVPLIVEPHPKDYSGFPFITLIQYRKHPMLTIVDNASDDVIRAFVLDLCGPERVDEELIIQVAADWYVNERGNLPISIQFSKLGISAHTAKIYRSLNVEFVSRVIGPVPKYPMTNVKSVKRRRRKAISSAALVESDVIDLT